ncbi:maleylacetate reductase [Nonomuraea monospora]|uniref:Maleylacetate reductase n=1 Tax=Nonomuraea monospora TaxID=568818 RepID=A0ABN3D4P3_9ACTN
MTRTTRSWAYEARPQRVVTGRNAAGRLVKAELDRLGARRIMLIAGKSELATAQKLLGGMAAAATFTGVRPHVPVEVAEAARACAAEAEADALLCVGGGSTTGTAKAVALTTGLPIVAVPTTYAGSEATDVWGLTEGTRKTNGADPSVLPRAVVYDPELLVTLPPALTVNSGLNALAHCVDSLWAPNAGPVPTALATEGARLLARGLTAVIADATDLAALEACQAGTYVAAAAFAAAGSGLHHKICHVLGGAYGLEHGAMHAVLLPHVLAFNEPAAPQAAARIAEALAGAGYGDGSHALAALLALHRALGAPTGLGALGLRADQVSEAAELVLEKVPATNPRPVTLPDLKALLHRARTGAEPVRDHVGDSTGETS